MKNLLLFTLYGVIFFTTLLLLGGCAGPKSPEVTRYFWPLPVAGTEPKIEYLGFYQSDYDLQVDNDSWVDTYVLGKFPPQALFSRPFDVCSTTDERLLVTDPGQNRVLVLDRTTLQVRSLLDMNGQPHFLQMPLSVAAAADGSTYVVDMLVSKVYKYSAEERLEAVVSKNMMLTRAVSVAVDSGNKLLYVVDAGAHNVVVADSLGNLLFKFGERGSAAGQFNYPTDISVDEQGNIYVLDTLNFRVQVFDPSGHFLRMFGENGTAAGSFRLPKGLAVSPQGHVYVTDTLSHRFVVFDTEGNYLLTIGDKGYHLSEGKVTPGGFFMPKGIHVDTKGGIYVVDSVNRMIQHYQYLTGDYLKKFPIDSSQIYFPPGSFKP